MRSRFNYRSVTIQLPTFRHQVAFYDDADGFLEPALEHLRPGLDAGEPTLAALGPARTEQLRAALGAEAEAVAFVDIERVGRNPARLIPALRDFVDRHPPGRPLRGLGEPVWPGRCAAARDECERHEALLNPAFGAGKGADFSLLCLYDRATLDDEALEAAALTHPLRFAEGGARANPEWDGHEPEPFGGFLPSPPLGALELEFDRETLNAVRAAAGVEAGEAGLGADRTDDLVLAAGELATNSVIHGGGHGTATIWREPGALLLEVRDAGWLRQPLAGRVRPDPTTESGRGLWVANQLCDLLQLRSGPAGTHARLWMELR